MSPQGPNQAIQWDFQLARQGNVTRYGRMGERYFKQYLPAGLLLPERHPPKAIHKRHYELARHQLSVTAE